jgi:hypothetical protein
MNSDKAQCFLSKLDKCVDLAGDLEVLSLHWKIGKSG